MMMASRDRGVWVFRIFGFGLHWKDTRLHRKLWTDRNRTYRQLEVGPWLFTPLKRGDRGWRQDNCN